MENPSRQRQWGQSEIAGGRHLFRLRMMIAEIERWAPTPSRVLDAGSGDGSLTLRLLARGHAVSAVDASPACLKRLTDKITRGAGARGAADRGAAALSRTKSGSQLTCSLAHLSALPFPDASFDLVVSGEVLEHLPDDRAAAREFFRVLRPGGYAMVSVPADPQLWDIEDEWAGHQRRYEKGGLENIFKDAGFTTVKLHHWGWPLTYYYDRYLFRYWLHRRVRKGDPNLNQTSAAGVNPLLARLMAAAFSLDRAFLFMPKGIGLLGVFKKA